MGADYHAGIYGVGGGKRAGARCIGSHAAAATGPGGRRRIAHRRQIVRQLLIWRSVKIGAQEFAPIRRTAKAGKVEGSKPSGNRDLSKESAGAKMSNSS